MARIGSETRKATQEKLERQRAAARTPDLGKIVVVPRKLCLRPLGSHSLAKAAGLGRYEYAASGLNRLRNSGKRNDDAQDDPGNHNFTPEHDYPQIPQLPRCGRLCSFFGKLPNRFRLA